MPKKKAAPVSSGAAAPVPSAKAQKAARRAERLAAEEERKREVERMMNIADDEDEDQAEEDEVAKLTDKFGNSLTASQKKESAAEKERAEARARREAKKKAAIPAVVDEPPPGQSSAIEELKAKAAAGGKLSNKERKLLKKEEARLERMAEEPPPDPLSQYSVTVESNASDSTQISLSGVSISAPAKALLVETDVKFRKGRRYGLLGPNGTGKSSLLKLLTSKKLLGDGEGEGGWTVVDNALLVDQEATNLDVERSAVEEVMSADAETVALEARARLLEDRIQNEDSNDASASTVEECYEELSKICDDLEARDAHKAEAKARSLLAGLGLSESQMDGEVKNLSGGWRVRVNLARALFVAPALCCLDEPSNHLDLDASIWLCDYLQDYREDAILVVASHDRDLLEEVCTDHVLLQHQELEYHKGGVRRLLAGQEQRRAKALRDYESHRKAIAEERKKHPNSSQVEERVKKRLGVPRLVVDRPSDYAARFDFGDAGESERVGGVSLREVSFGYEDEKLLFRDIDFDLTCATRSAVCGKNGSGKSTLLKLLASADDLAPNSGERTSDARLRLGYYDQHFRELGDGSLSSNATKMLCARFDIQEQKARATLGRFGLDSARHLIPVRDLSGGQKARVVFAIIALKNPHILVLDEPTNHLDAESVDALILALTQFKGGILAISHDAALVQALERDEDGVEQPLFICEREEESSHSTIFVERGGFKGYRRRLEREQVERQKRFDEMAQDRLKSRRERQRRLQDRRGGL